MLHLFVQFVILYIISTKYNHTILEPYFYSLIIYAYVNSKLVITVLIKCINKCFKYESIIHNYSLFQYKSNTVVIDVCMLFLINIFLLFSLKSPVFTLMVLQIENTIILQYHCSAQIISA